MTKIKKGKNVFYIYDTLQVTSNLHCTPTELTHFIFGTDKARRRHFKFGLQIDNGEY